MIEKLNKTYSVEKMCEALEVSVSGYYKWKTVVPAKRVERRKMLIKAIHSVFEQSKRRYGSPRVAKELNMQGINASEKFVARLMKQEGLRSIVRKKWMATTNSSHRYAVAENKLQRDFTATTYNKKWVSDITYIHTNEGWLYLTTVIDLFNRKVIGWALSDTMKTNDTVLPAFRMATINNKLNPNQTLLFHSDRGVQYACDEFREEIKKRQVVQSMSRKGNCLDNAVAESFFKTLKSELIYHYKYQTRKEAELSIFEFIEVWYNRKRRHKHLNNLTILEHENLLNNNF